ncbi:MAG: formate dehydrogenase accessory sulfurtransferase FdhD [Chromatiales bacterium]|nr:formate dehydrogenase accessory sulfurtransferase FdhD [Chromatiales bacterium]
MKKKLHRTYARLSPTFSVQAQDQYNQDRVVSIAGESPLTLIVDGHEVVTLMTLGTYPEELAIGYLRNQRLVEHIDHIASVEVDWQREAVMVKLKDAYTIKDWQEKLKKRIITSGCGQGTVFSCTLDKLYDQRLADVQLKQSTIYALLKEITLYNEIYRAAGAVHGCALCKDTEILAFVEDVGRHNAADAIAGMMCLEEIDGTDKIFYTTGRLTSEIVMKTAHMSIPILLSRSGITQMGLQLAKDLNVMMIARAKGKAFLVYHKHEQINYDASPTPPPAGRRT